ncbi:MAG: 30S ribosomal protein S20 [Candidatus Margulisiibacteriota bacterium]
MANLKASKKDIIRSKRNHDRNKHLKTSLKSALKGALNAVENLGETTEAVVLKTLQLIDRSVTKGILKKNTASRKKSRLMKAFNLAKSSAK